MSEYKFRNSVVFSGVLLVLFSCTSPWCCAENVAYQLERDICYRSTEEAQEDSYIDEAL